MKNDGEEGERRDNKAYRELAGSLPDFVRRVVASYRALQELETMDSAAEFAAYHRAGSATLAHLRVLLQLADGLARRGDAASPPIPRELGERGDIAAAEIETLIETARRELAAAFRAPAEE